MKLETGQRWLHNVDGASRLVRAFTAVVAGDCLKMASQKNYVSCFAYD